MSSRRVLPGKPVGTLVWPRSSHVACWTAALMVRVRRTEHVVRRRYVLDLRYNSPKNENLLTVYSPSGHPRCRWHCFFIKTDLEKFSITSLDHQWILCSEWVPLATVWSYKILMIDLFLTNMQLFTSQNVNWWSCGLLVDYCDGFISCLDSRFDGTHSLQRIHWWASDEMLYFFKSVLTKKQTHLHFGWSEGE